MHTTADGITPEIGMVASLGRGTDRRVYDVIGLKGQGTVILQERKAICTKNPQMEVGGFTGVVNEPAEWKTEKDPSGAIIEATFHKKIGKYKEKGTPLNGSMKSWGLVRFNDDRYFYDHGF